MTEKGFGYSYTNTRVRVMKSKLIDSNEYPKLLKMSLDQIARYLGETDYKTEIDELGATYDRVNLIEFALNKNLSSSFKKVLNFSLKDSRESIKLFLEKYDLHNIKTILRGKQSKESNKEIIYDLIPAGELTFAFLSDAVKKSSSVEDAIEFFRKTPYYETMKKNSSNLTEMEDELDINYYSKLIAGTKGKIRSLMVETAKFTDALNEARAKETKIQLKTILPQKKTYRKKIEVKSIEDSRIEFRKKIASDGIKLVNKFQRNSAPVIGYFVAKENEITNLRIISRGKHSGLPMELIEKQLVY
ncbi:MAG: V-type ATPase subunit [archaeon]